MTGRVAADRDKGVQVAWKFGASCSSERPLPADEAGIEPIEDVLDRELVALNGMRGSGSGLGGSHAARKSHDKAHGGECGNLAGGRSVRQGTSEPATVREAPPAERRGGSGRGRNPEHVRINSQRGAPSGTNTPEADRPNADEALAAKNRVDPTTPGGANRR